MAEYLEWSTEDDDGNEVIEKIPAKREICHRCEGRGKHVNPSVDGNGISQEDFDQDPDFREAYFEGRYDVTCWDCEGEKVILSPNFDTQWEPGLKERYDSWMRDEQAYAAECAAERKMGA